MGITICLLVTLLVGTTLYFSSIIAGFEGSRESLPFYVGAPQPFSYIVDSNSTNIFMYNGTTGEMEEDSTDSSEIINFCASNLTDGGKIFITASTYSISTSILLPDNVTLAGEGLSTKLVLADNVNEPVIRNIDQTNGNDNIVVQDLLIDGNKAGQTSNAVVIEFKGSATDKSTHNIEITRCKVINGKYFGISAAWGVNTRITNCWVEGNNERAISLEKQRGALVSKNHVYNNLGMGMWLGDCYSSAVEQNYVVENDHGGVDIAGYGYNTITGNVFYSQGNGASVALDGAVACTVSGNTIWNGNYEGIAVEGGTGWHVISGNTITGPLWEGIRIKNTPNVAILGNTIRNPSQGGNGEHPAIGLEKFADIPVLNNTVIGNIIITDSATKPSYGVEETDATCDYNLIQGNRIEEVVTSAIRLQGANSKATHNIGYVTENSGTSEASNDDWIAHGLVGEPTSVDLTIEETDANYFLQLKTTNSTHFQIYLQFANETACDVDKTINWYVEYQP